MEQKDKELLLKDLSARLPYGVKIYLKDFPNATFIGVVDEGIMLHCDKHYYTYDAPWDIEYVKPYLFPLSSMTEEQKEEYNSVCNKDLDALSEAVCNCTYVKTRIAMPLYYGIDWLNAHHFDYRGLIEKGLAIDCTNLNIY